MNYYMPTRIIIGENCILDNSDKITQLGKRCVIVTGKNSAKKCGALDDVIKALGDNCEYAVFDKIQQNPTISSCIEGGKIARAFGAEFIIGIGGGSPLDAAKAIAIFATNDINEKQLFSLDIKNSPLKVVAVGTTAGTGSEVTQVGVITASDGKKKSFRFDASYPTLAFGDTKYTDYLPDSVTRSTAVDALSHCVESYFCKNSTDISRAYALRGCKIMLDAISDICKGENLDRQLRDRLYIGSILGGLAISVTGTAFPHALGYFLTELHGFAHGTACAFYLPEFLRYNKQNAGDLYNEFVKVTSFNDEKFEKLISNVISIPKITIEQEEYDALRERWVNNSCISKMQNKMTALDLENIIHKCVASQNKL